MNTSQKPNPYSTFHQKTRQSTARAGKTAGRKSHHPLDDERKLLEILEHLSHQAEDLSVDNLYLTDSPAPMTEAPQQTVWFESSPQTAPSPTSIPDWVEPVVEPAGVSEQEMMAILQHISHHAETLEVTDVPSLNAFETEASSQTECRGPSGPDHPSTASGPNLTEPLVDYWIVNEQDAIDDLKHLSRQEEDLVVADLYHLEDVLDQDDLDANHLYGVETSTSETKVSSSYSRFSRNWLTRLGLTSLAVTGGGVGVWLTASILSPSTPDPNSEDLAVGHSDRDSEQTSDITATIAAPVLDSLSPEFNSSVIKPPKVEPKTSAPSAPPLEATAQPASSSPAPHANPLVVKPEAASAPHAVLSGLLQKRLLSPDDLQGLSDWDLTLLRNEIYARHGRHFVEPELQQYFEAQSWYQPRHAPGKFPISNLSQTEIQNAIFIRDYQRTHEKLYQWQ